MPTSHEEGRAGSLMRKAIRGSPAVNGDEWDARTLN